jgi:hypothetical protein
MWQLGVLKIRHLKRLITESPQSSRGNCCQWRYMKKPGLNWLESGLLLVCKISKSFGGTDLKRSRESERISTASELTTSFESVLSGMGNTLLMWR